MMSREQKYSKHQKMQKLAESSSSDSSLISDTDAFDKALMKIESTEKPKLSLT